MNRQQRRAAAKRGDSGDLCALAILLEQQGKTAEAVATYRRILSLNPRHGQAHNNLAVHLREKGRPEEAIAHFRKAIELEPRKCSYLRNLAWTLAQCGQLGEAAELYRRGITIEPFNADAHNGLGVVLVEIGQLDEGIAAYGRALAHDPHHIKARINLGIALARQGRTVEALDHAEIASRFGQEPSFPHYLMGVLLARCGAAEAARVCFEAYLERDPGDREGARLLLAKLGGTALPERASSLQLDRFYARQAIRWDEKAAGQQIYCAAELVASMLDRLTGATDRLDIADAGCGTGLVGNLVAKKARRLIGIDASSAMLAKAQQKGLYHQLHHGDLVAFLDGHAKSFDAVTCAATLIHFGDLRAPFAAAATSLRDGGLFVFTLFPNEDEDAAAPDSMDSFAEAGCFRHGRNYVARLAQATGFAVEALELGIHEYFEGTPKMGLVGALRRISHPQLNEVAAA